MHAARCRILRQDAPFASRRVRDATRFVDLLQQADPESIVLYLDVYADASDADEVRDVLFSTSGTHEKGRYGAEECVVHCLGAPAARRDRYS